MKFRNLYKNKFLLTLIIAGGVSLVLTALFLLGFFHTYHISMADAFYGEKEGLEEIAIIAIDDKSLQEIGRWPWDRKKFSEAIRTLNQSAVIGIDISFFERSTKESDLDLEKAINKSGNVVLVSEHSFNIENKQIVSTDFLEPIFSNADHGHINLFTDKDGIVRSFPSYMPNSTSFSIAIVEKYAKETEIPKLKQRELMNFYTKPSTISFSDLLNKKYTKSFKDKIVLIGATAPDFHDDHLVPVSKTLKMPGVEVHANIIQTILKKDFLQYQSSWTVIILIFLLSFVSGMLLYKLKFLLSTVIIFALIIAYYILSLYIFDYGIIMNPLYPPLAIILTYVAVTAESYIIEKKHKRWVTNLFGRYVSENVVKEILKIDQEDIMKLPGKRKIITILFADIRGFTPIAEKKQPEKVVKMLNTYLSNVTEAIFKHSGTIDKYIGDGIMVIWGAPIEQKDHALKAVKAAVEMQKIVNFLSKRKGLRHLSYGIGINTGSAIVGNIGTEKRLEYTAIGDTVNLASRLCSLAKKDEVLISKDTYNEVKNNVKIIEKRKLKVKGKKKLIDAYVVNKVF